MTLWSSVGLKWVEMMLDPKREHDVGLDTQVLQKINVNTEVTKVEERKERDELENSFGSLEGVGGDAGCESRTVELELLVNELRHQIAEFPKDKEVLREALTASEEQVVALVEQLREVRREKNTGRRQGVMEDQECENLLLKVDELQEEKDGLVKTLWSLELELSEGKKEVEEVLVRMEMLKEELNEKEKDHARLYKKLIMSANDFEEIKQSQEVPNNNAELEMLKQEIKRLQSELSFKEEEVKGLKNTTDEQGSKRSNISSSLVHDMSVDDRVFNEMTDVMAKPLKIKPSRCGPSASSTPHKHSIGDELKNLTSSPGMLSPFCEKIAVNPDHLAVCPKVQVERLQEGLAEKIRKVICDQMKGGSTGLVMAAVNKAFADLRTDTEHCLEQLAEEIKEVAYGEWQDLGQEPIFMKSSERKEIEVVQRQISEVVCVLKAANETLLGNKELSPGFIVEGEEDLSSWQLDLEGIQLVERGLGLGQRLLNYSLMSKKSKGGKFGKVGRGGLWQSLHKGLEDLQSQTQCSRDLLLLASDSVRAENTMELECLQSVSAKTSHGVACQTELGEQKSGGQCEVQGCFCGEGREEDCWGRHFSRGVSLFIVILLLFTFGCGLELEEKLYLPCTWYLLR